MKMKAIVYEKYGPPEVLHFKEVEKTTPKANELLIKVYATTVHRGDSRMRSFMFHRGCGSLHEYLLVSEAQEKNLGMELAGEIEKVSKT